MIEYIWNSISSGVIGNTAYESLKSILGKSFGSLKEFRDNNEKEKFKIVLQAIFEQNNEVLNKVTMLEKGNDIVNSFNTIENIKESNINISSGSIYQTINHEKRTIFEDFIVSLQDLKSSALDLREQSCTKNAKLFLYNINKTSRFIEVNQGALMELKGINSIAEAINDLASLQKKMENNTSIDITKNLDGITKRILDSSDILIGEIS